MTKHNKYSGILFVFPAVLFVIMLISINTAYAGNVVVIVNANGPATNLSIDELKNIYSGITTKWKDNSTIMVSIASKAEYHKDFCKKFVKKNPSQFKNTWKKLAFMGKGRKPKKLKTGEDVISYVTDNVGAIGYVTSDMVTDKVKIVGQ